MNKAKLMLSALGVLAVIGSALAFKAHSTFSGNLKCATSATIAGAPNLAGSLCTSLTYTTTLAEGTFRHCKAINAADIVPCVAQRVTTQP